MSSDPGPNGITVVLTVEDASDGSTTRLCTRFAGGDVTRKDLAGGCAGRYDPL